MEFRLPLLENKIKLILIRFQLEQTKEKGITAVLKFPHISKLSFCCGIATYLQKLSEPCLCRHDSYLDELRSITVEKEKIAKSQ